ncbi:MAG: hypothetical protein ABIQ15_13110 [Nocardioides sp.]
MTATPRLLALSKSVVAKKAWQRRLSHQVACPGFPGGRRRP